MEELEKFIGKNQLQAMRPKGFDSVKQRMIDTFRSMPKTYEQDGKGDKAVAYLHYFHSSIDWYITEKDMEEEQLQAFGLVSFHGQCPEIGYISIPELLDNDIEIDLYFEPKTLCEIKKQL
ncbi:DUF2958 domain-containing protein [Aquamicrobium sp.]|uniref:DUF2958 domain-containing protein n=1 Tax=Aquamicrobium sp. TaxID=1872579 RepID=UPI00258F9090|nr:DUF2958 domain-containing protein [Aquamicrobium sp.]MCK9551152.1 DUF2958 domain-containing protein [Aquamicrobium sp.]